MGVAVEVKRYCKLDQFARIRFFLALGCRQAFPFALKVKCMAPVAHCLVVDFGWYSTGVSSVESPHTSQDCNATVAIWCSSWFFCITFSLRRRVAPGVAFTPWLPPWFKASVEGMVRSCVNSSRVPSTIAHAIPRDLLMQIKAPLGSMPSTHGEGMFVARISSAAV